MAPKHIFNGKDIIEIASQTSASKFNEGYASVLKVMEVMGVKIGPTASHVHHVRDAERLADAEKNLKDAAKEARIARREQIALQNKMWDDSEGISYGAEIAD